MTTAAAKPQHLASVLFFQKMGHFARQRAGAANQICSSHKQNSGCRLRGTLDKNSLLMQRPTTAFHLCLNVLMLLGVRNPSEASICVSASACPERWGDSRRLTIFVLTCGVWISPPSPPRSSFPLISTYTTFLILPYISSFFSTPALLFSPGSCSFLITLPLSEGRCNATMAPSVLCTAAAFAKLN